jgi:hypothetical protein
MGTGSHETSILQAGHSWRAKPGSVDSEGADLTAKAREQDGQNEIRQTPPRDVAEMTVAEASNLPFQPFVSSPQML